MFLCLVQQQRGDETERPSNVDTHPQSVQAVLDSFYVDDRLTGANSIEEAERLRKELQELFALGGFALHNGTLANQPLLSTFPLTCWTRKLCRRSLAPIPSPKSLA